MFWFKKRKLDMQALFWVSLVADDRAGKAIPPLHPLLLDRLKNENIDMLVGDIERVLRGTDIRKSIIEIVKTYPTMTLLLRAVVEKKYPQHLDYLEKVLILA